MASSIMVKRIIIIGATSGIGYEVAKIYWKRGYQLGLAGRRVDRLEEFRRQDPEHIRIKQLDVTAEDAADRLEELIRDLGGMDIFLLSSGIGNQNKYLDTSIEQVTIQTNVTGFTRIYVVCPRDDRSRTLLSVCWPEWNRSCGNSYRSYGANGCFWCDSSGLPLDEPGDRNSYFTGVLLGYHGNVIRTEPCILEYEPGWAAPSPIFSYP